MPDVEDQVREMLRRRAGDVSPHIQPPRGMLRRAWRRILLTFTGGAIVVALVGLGAAAGLRLESRRTGLGSPTTPGACSVSELRGKVNLQGEGAQVTGWLEIINAGTEVCTLKGQPRLMIVDRTGRPLGISEDLAAPSWTVDARPQPKGWPVVTLRPGGAARVRIVWNSWCGYSGHPAVWRIWLRDAGSLDLPDPHGYAPPCVEGPSRVEVGPFEPVS